MQMCYALHHPRDALGGVPLLMMFCRTWALSKGFVPRGLSSIASKRLAITPWDYKRLCTVKAVSTKVALTDSRPLVVLTTA